MNLDPNLSAAYELAIRAGMSTLSAVAVPPDPEGPDDVAMEHARRAIACHREAINRLSAFLLDGVENRRVDAAMAATRAAREKGGSP